jgi:hypothetical protein
MTESLVMMFNKGKEVYYLNESASLFDSLPLTAPIEKRCPLTADAAST